MVLLIAVSIGPAGPGLPWNRVLGRRPSGVLADNTIGYTELIWAWELIFSINCTHCYTLDELFDGHMI